jgi:hypothetical protein
MSNNSFPFIITTREASFLVEMPPLFIPKNKGGAINCLEVPIPSVKDRDPAEIQFQRQQ